MNTRNWTWYSKCDCTTDVGGVSVILTCFHIDSTMELAFRGGIGLSILLSPGDLCAEAPETAVAQDFVAAMVSQWLMALRHAAWQTLELVLTTEHRNSDLAVEETEVS